MMCGKTQGEGLGWGIWAQWDPSFKHDYSEFGPETAGSRLSTHGDGVLRFIYLTFFILLSTPFLTSSYIIAQECI